MNIKKTLMFFSHVEQPTKSILGRANDDISAYSREEHASLEFHPLLWWQANSYYYLFLYVVYRFILGIPATSLPSEREFSTACDIVIAQGPHLD